MLALTLALLPPFRPTLTLCTVGSGAASSSPLSAAPTLPQDRPFADVPRIGAISSGDWADRVGKGSEPPTALASLPPLTSEIGTASDESSSMTLRGLRFFWCATLVVDDADEGSRICDPLDPDVGGWRVCVPWGIDDAVAPRGRSCR